jgi:hypothetical protein
MQPLPLPRPTFFSVKPWIWIPVAYERIPDAICQDLVVSETITFHVLPNRFFISKLLIKAMESFK